jgi:DnaA family protein
MQLQLHLNLIEAPSPQLADGVTGANTAALAALRSFLGDRDGGFGSLMLWGGPGSGKSFWLKAWARALGTEATFTDCASRSDMLTAAATAAVAPADAINDLRDAVERLSVAEPAGAQPRIWLIDNIDMADDAGAHLLFRLYNAARERHMRIVSTAARPPLHLTMRDDLRTRIAQGLVFELAELTDDDKKNALRERAARLGMPLGEELIAYMFTRLQRHLGTLAALVDRLNDLSLAQKRPVTLPLLKELIESLDATTRPV